MKYVYFDRNVWILGPLFYKKYWKYEQRFAFSSLGKSDWSSIHVHDQISFEKWPKFRSRMWTERKKFSSYNALCMIVLLNKFGAPSNHTYLKNDYKSQFQTQNFIMSWCQMSLSISKSSISTFFFIIKIVPTFKKTNEKFVKSYL